MENLTYFVEKYNLDLSLPSPIEIPNVGRDIFGHWFRDLNFKMGVELGVERGIFSQILMTAHPEMLLYCVDPWIPYVGYRAKVNNDDLIRAFDETKERLEGYNVKFMREFSEKALHNFRDNSLDFVYIDANHDLPWVMDDIIGWEKKVRPGGMVAGHDYRRKGPNPQTRVYVVEALNWYTNLKPIKTWFVLGTKEIIPGQIRDNTRSWMWIKE